MRPRDGSGSGLPLALVACVAIVGAVVLVLAGHGEVVVGLLVAVLLALLVLAL